MRKKQWILLLAVLIAFVAATAGMKGYQKKQDKKAAQKEEDAKVYALQFVSDDVTGIAYEKDGQWLAFTKNDDTWSCETDTAAVIDSDKMKTMLSSLGSMTADSTVEHPDDIAQYGLDAPSMQAILTFADGDEKTLTFGSTNEIVGGTYVQISDDDNVYLVGSSYVNTTLNKSIDDLTVDESTDTTETTDNTETDQNQNAAETTDGVVDNQTDTQSDTVTDNSDSVAE